MTNHPPSTSGSARRRRAVTSIVTTEVVRDVALRLAAVDVMIMPVKGALLQHWLFEDPADRAMTDVDLLVRPEQFELACQRLVASGYVSVGQSSIGARVLRSPLHVAVDLHPCLFDPARYRLSTSDVFARSSVDESLFGASVRLPSPPDAYAHLVGKFASDHRTALDTGHLDELRRMSSRLGRSPRGVADHLVRTGMRRAARYVLPLCRATGDTMAGQVFDALPHDPAGSLLAPWAGRVFASPWGGTGVGGVAAHMLNDTLGRAAWSGVRAMSRRRN
ncbi:MAG: nucleotidyltransferase family protein [Myxococcota bacterium]